MGNIRQALTFFGTLLLAATALSGCTAPAPVPSQGPKAPSTVQSTLARSQDAPVLAKQRASVEGYTPNAGVVLRQYAGTGPVSMRFGPLSANQKHVGISVQCDGTGRWEAKLSAQKLATGNGVCSAEGVLSLAFPLKDPGIQQSFIVTVPDGARVWATVYSTN